VDDAEGNGNQNEEYRSFGEAVRAKSDFPCEPGSQRHGKGKQENLKRSSEKDYESQNQKDIAQDLSVFFQHGSASKVAVKSDYAMLSFFLSRA
jgi:hypothetical protein